MSIEPWPIYLFVIFEPDAIFAGMGISVDPNRYVNMEYSRCGRSGLLLPKVSLGLWHNFGGVDVFSNARDMILRSFDLGITHFDLANNYGPPGGSAEETFGTILRDDLTTRRDELVISTKAGYRMWDGPYGEWGSRKHMVSSLDQSLRRMGLEYVDIYYHHRMDPDTPLEETMSAMAHLVNQGKALYVGLSNYSPEKTRQAAAILRALGTPCLIHQPPYNMLFRNYETAGLFPVLEEEGIGCINFSPLAQGMLTDRYLNGVPEDSRAEKPHGFLTRDRLTEDVLHKVRKLNVIANRRGQTLAQLAITWCLSVPKVTSVLIGASRVSQIEDCVGGLGGDLLSDTEIAEIEAVLD